MPGNGVGDVPIGNYKVVGYDLDTTGRRLMDEICHIGCYYVNPQAGEKTGEQLYSQYVIPHRNPNQAARRAYGIKVVNIGRARMLKELETGKILKTKSEISALQDFLGWLEGVKGESDGVILVSHEQVEEKVILAPLLLQSFERYNLLEKFSSLVKGFCNSADVISDLGNKDSITSLSLRSLCKTVLQDTSLPTRSATNRCQRVYEVLSRVTGGAGAGDAVADQQPALEKSLDKLIPYTRSIQQSTKMLRSLQDIDKLQSTLRPIFQSLMAETWNVRERMLRIRRSLALAGLNYEKLKESLDGGKLDEVLGKVELGEDDRQEMINVVKNHFNVMKSKSELKKVPPPPTSEYSGASEAAIAEAEAVKAEAVKAEAVKAEAVKADAVKAEAVKADAVKTDAVKAEAVKAVASKVEAVNIN